MRASNPLQVSRAPRVYRCSYFPMEAIQVVPGQKAVGIGDPQLMVKVLAEPPLEVRVGGRVVAWSARSLVSAPQRYAKLTACYTESGLGAHDSMFARLGLQSSKLPVVQLGRYHPLPKVGARALLALALLLD